MVSWHNRGRSQSQTQNEVDTNPTDNSMEEGEGIVSLIETLLQLEGELGQAWFHAAEVYSVVIVKHVCGSAGVVVLVQCLRRCVSCNL